MYKFCTRLVFIKIIVLETNKKDREIAAVDVFSESRLDSSFFVTLVTVLVSFHVFIILRKSVYEMKKIVVTPLYLILYFHFHLFINCCFGNPLPVNSQYDTDINNDIIAAFSLMGMPQNGLPELPLSVLDTMCRDYKTHMAQNNYVYGLEDIKKIFEKHNYHCDLPAQNAPPPPQPIQTAAASPQGQNNIAVPGLPVLPSNIVSLFYRPAK